MVRKMKIWGVLVAAVLLTGCNQDGVLSSGSGVSGEVLHDTSSSNSDSTNESTLKSSTKNETTELDNNKSTFDMNSLYDVDYDKLYSEIKEVANAKDFTGDWKRTNTHSSIIGDITITDQTSKGFHFSGDFSYYSHTGDATGDAMFVADNIAIYREEGVMDNSQYGYIAFFIDNGELFVASNGNAGCMGMNVSPLGEYTKGDPVYTNEGMLDKSFTKEQLEKIKQCLSADEYDSTFEYATENGGFAEDKEVTLISGIKANYKQCIVPTLGISYEIIFTEDGHFYYLNGNGTFFTNDDSYTEKTLPQTKGN